MEVYGFKIIHVEMLQKQMHIDTQTYTHIHVLLSKYMFIHIALNVCMYVFKAFARQNERMLVIQLRVLS